MRGKKQNVHLWAVAFWLIVWQLAALALHAAYPHGALLLPSPVSSLARLLSLAGTAVFWCAIGTSSMHILGGFLLSCALAVVLAALSARFSRVKELLAPLVAAVKTVKLKPAQIYASGSGLHHSGAYLALQPNAAAVHRGADGLPARVLKCA